MGTSGPNRDLFQERQALSGIAGTTYEPYQRSRHHRTQHLQVGEGGVLRLEPGKPGVGGRPLFYKPSDSWESSKAGDERLGWSTRPSSAPSKGKPNWIGRDKQVTRSMWPSLRFCTITFRFSLLSAITKRWWREARKRRRGIAGQDEADVEFSH